MDLDVFDDEGEGGEKDGSDEDEEEDDDDVYSEVVNKIFNCDFGLLDVDFGELKWCVRFFGDRGESLLVLVYLNLVDVLFVCFILSFSVEFEVLFIGRVGWKGVVVN